MPSVSAEAHAALVALSRIDGSPQALGFKILAALRRDTVEEVLAALNFNPDEIGYAEFSLKLKDVSAARNYLPVGALVLEILEMDKSLESRAGVAAKSFRPAEQAAA